MTTPEHHDPIGSALAARLSLDTAIDQLTQPGIHHLDRSRAVSDHDVAQTDEEAAANHRDQMRRLRRRHDAARGRRDAAGMRRTLQALVAREQAYRAAADARAADTAPLPSLLQQLQEAVESSQGVGNGSAGPNRAPIGLNAAELLGHMQRTSGHRDGPLADTLRAWAADPPDLTQAAALAEQWVTDARAIVTPDRGFEIGGACPLCGTRHVWVQDGDERVRKAAIQVSYATRSARCIAHGCTGRWTKDYLEHLARVVVQDRDERAG